MDDGGSDPARDVLRYWRAVLAAEAAASGGCDDVPLPSPAAAVEPDLVRPPSVARHLVVALDRATPEAVGVERLVTREAGGVFLELRGDRVPFFEHWLGREYWKQWAKSSGQTSAEQDSVWLAGFPVLATARFGRRRLDPVLTLELAEVVWLDEARELWRAPTWPERKASKVGPPPRMVRLRARKPGAAPPGAEGEGLAEPALRVDLGLLERELGLEGDAIEALGEALEALDGASADEIVGVLVTHLWALREAPEPTPDGTLVQRLCDALTPWALDRGAELRADALIYDAASGAPTAQLQRELGELLAEDLGPKDPTPLVRYLRALPARAARTPHLGLFAPVALTEAQRAVAETALATPLLAAEGPPGTGKTHVILALAAHTVVAAARAGCWAPGDGGARTSAPQLVVTSTNNRAVDNVVDPLTRDWPAGGLPVGLRTGSRIVQAGRMAGELDRVLAWLEGAGGSDAASRHTAAAAEFAARLAEVEGALAPLTEAQAAAEALARAEAEREEVERALAALGPPVADPPGDGEAFEAAFEALSELAAGVEDAYDRLDEERGAWNPERLKRLWKKHVRELVAPAERRAAAVGLALPSLERPGAKDDADVWREALFVLHGRLERVVEAAGVRMRALGAARRRAELEGRLRDVDARARSARARVASLRPPDARALRNDLAQAEYGLFQAACALREGWAAARKDELTRFVKKVRDAAGGRGGQVLALLDPDDRRRFGQLFPVLGCTLLSIGNAFPLAEGVVDTLVVDEAGQCPPSHVATALFRARRATLVGDIHQLEPVFGLAAAEERRLRERVAPGMPAKMVERFRMAQPGGTSAQRAAETVGPRLRLTDHFRCQPDIIGISDRLCGYGLTVHTPARSLEALSPFLRAPVLALPVRGVQRRAGGSWCNDDEARRLAAMADYLLRAGLGPEQIGLLTPFRAQARLVAQHLRERRLPVESWDGLPDPMAAAGLLLGTVHRLQGGERDVVLFSTVASEAGALAFLDKKPNLVNVAASRARTHLVLVGHPEALEAGRTTRELLAALRPESWLEPR